MTTSEKVAYLKGLAEGMGVEDANQGKLIKVIIDILEDLALDLADTRSSVEELNDGVEELSDDLTALEDEFYDTVYGEFDPTENEGDEDEDEEDEDEDEEIPFDGVLYDVKCPVCGEEITFGEETLEEGSIVCPKCGETLEFDLSGEND
jgi:ribosomal protein S27E